MGFLGVIMRSIFLLLLGISCLPFFAQAQTNENKSFPEFIIYQDKNSSTHYTPSGYMPTGECIKMDDGWQQNCRDGKTCIKVIYDVPCSNKGRHWAGVYWLHPADNWGDKKGGYNLTGAKRLVFWARGEKGGEQIAEFKIGGVGMNREYPDSDAASIGPVILTNQWREYTIDLRGKDLSSISGGFAWIANVDDNPLSCIFYIDDIYFE